MERSFYYVITWSEANALVRELSERFIPFALVQSKLLNIPPNQKRLVKELLRALGKEANN